MAIPISIYRGYDIPYQATRLPSPLQVGGTEWLWIVLVAAIFLFGSKKIPEVANALGRAMGQFQKGKAEIERQVREASQQATQTVQATKQELVSPPKEPLKMLNKEELQKAAAAFGIDASTKSEEELRRAIKEKLG